MSNFRKIFSHARQEITNAFAKAKPVFSSSGIKVLYASNASLMLLDRRCVGAIKSPQGCEIQGGRLLVVIPRTSGKACKRNRFRRRVKSLFYEEKWSTRSGFWIIIAYPRALALDFDALKALLQKVFNVF